MSYALLGGIAFDLLNAPTALDERHTAVFAEHQVLSGKPRLQAMGLDLVEMTLRLNLHHKLGDVERRYQALKEAKSGQQALALMMGNNQFRGHYVITELSSTIVFTDDKGNALAREVNVSLREFVGNSQPGLLGGALQLGTNSPLASILPPGALVGINAVKHVVTKGIQVYRQVKQTVNEVRNTAILIKTLAKDPLSAIAQLPGALNMLGVSTGALSEMLGMRDTFNVLTQGIAGAADFMRDIQEVSGCLNEVKSQFNLGLNDNAVGNWFDLGVQAVTEAENILDRLSAPAAQMTAWIAIRADNPPSQG